MRNYFIGLILFFQINAGCAKTEQIEIVENKGSFHLLVNNKPFFINGMNWDYFPIGTNYKYSLWSQNDETIKAALKAEMTKVCLVF